MFRSVPAIGLLALLAAACGSSQPRPKAPKPAPAPVAKSSHPALAAAHTGIEECDAKLRPIAGVWTDARMREVEAQLVRAAPSYGADLANALRPLLDAHTRRWARQRASACKLRFTKDAIDEVEHTRRQACYDDALATLSRYLWWLSQADARVSEGALDGLWELESRLPACDLPAVFDTYGSRSALRAAHAAIAGVRIALAFGAPDHAAGALAEAERLGERMELFRPTLMTLRGRLLLLRGELNDAEIMLGRAVELHTQHRNAAGLAEAHAALGELLLRTRQPEEAIWQLGQAHRLTQGFYGDDSPMLLPRLLWLSDAARLAGRHKAARGAARDALALARRALPAGHPMTLEASGRLARAALSAGDARDALQWLQTTVDGRVALLGRQHPEVADDLHLAARIRGELKHHEKALSLYQAAARIRNLAYGTRSEKVLASLTGAADMYRQLGRRRAAARDYEQALRIRRSLGDEPSPALARAIKDAAVALIELGKPPPRTLEYLEEARELDEHLFGRDHVQIAIDLHLFGRYHAARGEHELAYDYHQRAHDRLFELFGPEDQRVKQASAMLQATADAIGARR